MTFQFIPDVYSLFKYKFQIYISNISEIVNYRNKNFFPFHESFSASPIVLLIFVYLLVYPISFLHYYSSPSPIQDSSKSFLSYISYRFILISPILKVTTVNRFTVCKEKKTDLFERGPSSALHVQRTLERMKAFMEKKL